MRRLVIPIIMLVLSAVLVIGACAPAAPATENAAEFFKNNAVTLLINSSPGGTTDATARLVANFWGQVTGGIMIPKNEAAGGGVVAPNLVYAAKPDGLTIGAALAGTMMLWQLFEEPGMQFDVAKLNWIGSSHVDPYIFAVAAGSPAQSMQDVQKMEGFKFVSMAPRSATTVASAIVADIFSLKGAKVVTGFHSADVDLALIRGEADGYVRNCGSATGMIAKGASKKPFLAVGYQRSDFFPETPAISEAVTLTAEQKAMLDFFNSVAKGGKAFFAPPDMPKDRIQFMRDAFDKISANQEYLEQSKKLYGIFTGKQSGADLAKEIATEMKRSSDKEMLAKVLKVIDKYAVAKAQ